VPRVPFVGNLNWTIGLAWDFAFFHSAISQEPSAYTESSLLKLKGQKALLELLICKKQKAHIAGVCYILRILKVFAFIMLFF
jgi:hypothetical protein